MSVEKEISQEISSEPSEAKIREVCDKIKEFEDAIYALKWADLKDYQDTVENTNAVMKSVPDILAYCEKHYTIMFSDIEGVPSSAARDLLHHIKQLLGRCKDWSQILVDADTEGRLSSQFQGEKSPIDIQRPIVKLESMANEKIEKIKANMIAHIQAQAVGRILTSVPHLPYSFKSIMMLLNLIEVDTNTLMDQFHRKNPAHKKGWELEEYRRNLKGKYYDASPEEEKKIQHEIDQLDQEI